jgi:putative ABC transport system substrate-binding protein
VANTDKLAKFAVEKKVILSSPQREGVESGALFSYGFCIEDAGLQAARIVHLVLNGTDPGTIPVELADFILSINLETADRIGAEVPGYLLKNAFIVRQ